MSNYITEAFKQMALLESEDISLNADGIDKLVGFMDEAGVDPDEEMVDVFDLEAEAQEDLKDSYLGKVILECSVCHSHLFEDKANIDVNTDEEGLACHDLECPYCMSNEGYFVIGEVAPFSEAESEELQDDEEEVESDLPDVDIEGGADDIDEEDLEESLKESVEPELKGDGVEELYDNQEIRGVEELKGDEKLEGDDAIRGPLHKTHVNESCDEEKIDEALESATIETEDQTINLSTGDDGSVSLEAAPKADEFGFEEAPMAGEEMIAPLSDESVDEIEAAADANTVEDGEEDMEFEDMAEEEFPIEDEFEEFDEESFNGLGESYLRSCYENVKGFKTTGVSVSGKNLFIEGVIKFDSGNEKKTKFVFEALGDHKFEGYNEQISRGKKTYKMTTSANNKKLVCETFNYNYRSKNELNESVRVYGTVKRK